MEITICGRVESAEPSQIAMLKLIRRRIANNDFSFVLCVFSSTEMQRTAQSLMFFYIDLK